MTLLYWVIASVSIANFQIAFLIEDAMTNNCNSERISGTDVPSRIFSCLTFGRFS